MNPSLLDLLEAPTTPYHATPLLLSGKKIKAVFSVEKLFISKQQCAKIFHLKEEGQACADKNVKLFHFYKTFQSRALTLVSSSKLAKPKIELLDSLSSPFSPPSSSELNVGSLSLSLSEAATNPGHWVSSLVGNTASLPCSIR